MVIGRQHAAALKERPGERAAVRAERFELLAQVELILEPLMVILGLVFLALFVVDFSGLTLTVEEHRWLDRSEVGIYWVFIGEFALRFLIAPDKLPFLRQNWLTVLSLALPLLRPLRVLRVAPALGSVQAVRLLSGANEGLRALRTVTRGRQFVYAVVITLTATLLSAGAVLYFDRHAPGSPFRSFGEALWWAATLVTTINSSDDPVSGEGRIVAVLLRVYAVSVFGFITASIASHLIGTSKPAAPLTGTPPEPPARDLREHLADLEHEIALLRRHLVGGVAPVEAAAPAATPPPTAQGRSTSPR